MRLSQVVKNIKSAKEFIKENKIEPEYYVALYYYNESYDKLDGLVDEYLENLKVNIKGCIGDVNKDIEEIIIVWEEENASKNK